MSLITIIGASSGIGLATMQTALDAGHSVRAVARGAANIPLQHERLQKQPGDALSADDVAAAVAGAQVVVQSLGVPFDARMLFGPISLFSQATQLLIPAMQAAGVQRLVAVTGYGAGDSRDSISPLQRAGFELVFGRAYRDKDTQEALIRGSSLQWTIVRPGILTNSRRLTYQALTTPERWRNGIVSRKAVAHYIIHQAVEPEAIGLTPVLVG